MRKILIVGFMLLFLALGGCNNENNTNSLGPTNVSHTAQIRKTPVIKTQTIPAQTNTQIFTQNPTPTIKPTIPQIATQPFVTKEENLRFLYAENNNCKYPCWWGIIPGITSWTVAEEFLTPIAEEITLREKLRFIEMTTYDIGIDAPDSPTNDLEYFTVVVDDNDLVFLVTLLSSYPPIRPDLSSFLEKNGKPSEIYIWASGASPIYSLDEYRIALYYDNGILVNYYGKSPMDNEFVWICPEQFMDYTSLVFWNPDVSLSFDFLGEILLSTDSLEYLPLEEISKNGVLDFYEIYRNADSDIQCFEIPTPNYEDVYGNN